jgi:signal peptidase I
MREDVAAGETVRELRDIEGALKLAIGEGDIERLDEVCERANRIVSQLEPAGSFSGFRENLEVVVVAVAVAMAFRCYFLQPFKIPTGSMQPTLYGIHHAPQAGRTVFDHVPLSFAKWIVLGMSYTEFKAQNAGRFYGPRAEQGGMLLYEVNGIAHAIPRDLVLKVKNGDEVVTGQVLAEGNEIIGDHLFVNRVRWNFLPPRRGEVMVFRTDGIPALNDKKTHYIKRLCGLPGETISIQPPGLMVNGVSAREVGMLQTIQKQSPGYAGYQLAGGKGAEYLSSSNDAIKLRAGQYLGFGDNTMNSYDSRYWGPVPETSLVGPAWLVYWPISARWGLVK